MMPAPAAGADDPWSVDPRDYPLGAPFREQLRFLLRFAILAPSTHNTQPWRFRLVGDDAVEVWADAERALPRIDPARRQLFMSCGAALFHLRIGMRRFGSLDVVEYLPDPRHPDLLARLRRGRPVRPDARAIDLFDAIPRRRTDRGPFAPRPIGAEDGEQIVREAATEGAWMQRLHPHDKLAVALLVASGDRKQLADPAFRRELSRWLVPRGSRRRDGIPMVKKDVPTALPIAGLALLRTFDVGGGVAAREQELATRSPMLAVLGTELDEPRDWITAGEGMEAALLRATALGLGASFLNQAIEEPELRGPIGRAARTTGVAQLVLRFGRGGEVAPTPRRPLDDVVEEDR
jgi:nitroreductase